MDDTTDLYQLALGVLASTPQALVALLKPLPAAIWMRSPAPGEWTPQEVLAHLLHVETAVIPVRVRHMLEADGAPLPGAAPELAPGAPEEMLAAWGTAREQNLAFLRTLTPAQLAQGGEHPRFGHISAREHIIEWGYHDLEHVRQLQATLEACLYSSIGGFRALYSPPYSPEVS